MLPCAGLGANHQAEDRPPSLPFPFALPSLAMLAVTGPPCSGESAAMFQNFDVNKLDAQVPCWLLVPPDVSEPDNGRSSTRVLIGTPKLLAAWDLIFVILERRHRPGFFDALASHSDSYRRTVISFHHPSLPRTLPEDEVKLVRKPWKWICSARVSSVSASAGRRWSPGFPHFRGCGARRYGGLLLKRPIDATRFGDTGYFDGIQELNAGKHIAPALRPEGGLCTGREGNLVAGSGRATGGFWMGIALRGKHTGGEGSQHTRLASAAMSPRAGTHRMIPVQVSPKYLVGLNLWPPTLKKVRPC